MIYSTTITLFLRRRVPDRNKLIRKFAVNGKIILSRGEINGEEIET